MTLQHVDLISFVPEKIFNGSIPIPLSKQLLTYYAAFQAEEGFKEHLIKTYIADALHHLQITMGLPGSCDMYPFLGLH